MAMGKRKAKQESLWVSTDEMARSQGHPFYCKVNEILERWYATNPFKEAKQYPEEASVPCGRLQSGAAAAATLWTRETEDPAGGLGCDFAAEPCYGVFWAASMELTELGHRSLRPSPASPRPVGKRNFQASYP